VIWPVKLDEENATCAGLAQEIGFWLRIIAHVAKVGKRHSSSLIAVPVSVLVGVGLQKST
jgi:hypothetical protein